MIFTSMLISALSFGVAFASLFVIVDFLAFAHDHGHGFGDLSWPDKAKVLALAVVAGVALLAFGAEVRTLWHLAGAL